MGVDGSAEAVEDDKVGELPLSLVVAVLPLLMDLLLDVLEMTNTVAAIAATTKFNNKAYKQM